MAELATTTAASVYNQVYHLQKPDYSREVTDESKKAYIFVLLTSSQGTNTESRVMIDIWRELATRFGDVKFCQIRADLCIEGYPDKNTPTVLIYKDGDIKKQLVTLRELGGVRTNTRGTFTVLLAALVGEGQKSMVVSDETSKARCVAHVACSNVLQHWADKLPLNVREDVGLWNIDKISTNHTIQCATIVAAPWLIIDVLQNAC
jgi:hypothetical protein